MAAIPTTYSDVRFRSRLEARWAVFFDEVGWPWQYEPFDLAGYIPDFIIPVGWGGETHPLLVEVKPAQYITELPQHAEKILRSGWAGDSLIVGGTTFEQYESGHDVLGLMLAPSGQLAPARAFMCEECRRLSFAAQPGLVVGPNGDIRQGQMLSRAPCRLCGDTGVLSAGGHVVDSDREGKTCSALLAWAVAGNRVQRRGGV